MVTIYTKTSVFRQWLKGRQFFAVALCHSSHVADGTHRLATPHKPKAARSRLRVERYKACNNPLEFMIAGRQKTLQVPRRDTPWHLRSLNSSSAGYFIGRATGSGRPSFQLTRRVTVSAVASSNRAGSRNSPAGV